MNKMYSSMRMRSTFAVLIAMFLIACSNHQCATAQQTCTPITLGQISSKLGQHCGPILNIGPVTPGIDIGIGIGIGTTLNPNDCCRSIRDIFDSPCLCSPGSTLVVPNTLREFAEKNCDGIIVFREVPQCPPPREITCTPVMESQLDFFDQSCPAEKFNTSSPLSDACCWRLRHRLGNTTCLCSSKPFNASPNFSKVASICKLNLRREIRQCQRL